jgi:hypothetical protein
LSVDPMPKEAYVAARKPSKRKLAKRIAKKR